MNFKELIHRLNSNILIKTATIYIVASWVIIQVVAVIFPILDLTKLHQRWVLFILLLGLPIVIMITWSSQATTVRRKKRSRWLSGIFSTLILVIGLLVGFQTMGTSMSYTIEQLDENGKRKEYRLYKSEFINDINVFQFENRTDDENLNWLAELLTVGLYDDLSLLSFIDINYNTANSINEMGEIARRNNADYFITGNYSKDSSDYIVTINLHQSQNLKVVQSEMIRTTNLIDIIDDLTIMLLEWLEVDPAIIDDEVDLPFRSYMSANDSAVMFFYKEQFANAVRLDSTFAAAAMQQAARDYITLPSSERAQKYIGIAMENKEKLPYQIQALVLSIYYTINEDFGKALTVLNNEIEKYPNSVLLRQFEIYFNSMLKPEDVIESYRELSRVRELSPVEMTVLGRKMMENGNLDEAENLFTTLLEIQKETRDESYFHLATIKHFNGAYDLAEHYYSEFELRNPTNEDVKRLRKSINYYKETPREKLETLLKQLSGKYKYQRVESNLNFYKQGLGVYFYQDFRSRVPAFLENDSTVIGYIPSNNSFYDFDVAVDSLEKGARINVAWKVNDDIEAARKALYSGNYGMATPLFRALEKKQPNHLFLAKYFKHLSYMEDKKFSDFEFLVGTYGDQKIWLENDRLWYQRGNGIKNLVLPIADDWLQVSSYDHFMLEVVFKDDKVHGLQRWDFNRQTEVFEKNDEDFSMKATSE